MTFNKNRLMLTADTQSTPKTTQPAYEARPIGCFVLPVIFMGVAILAALLTR